MAYHAGSASRSRDLAAEDDHPWRSDFALGSWYVRVTWLTDLHLNFIDEDRFAVFMEALRREAPDVMLVTGDTAESTDFVSFIERLTHVAPLYFVLGNHDFYGSSVTEVRRRARATKCWLPSVGPVQLTKATALIGVDGWGDARCGNLGSRVMLADWQWIRDLQGLTKQQRIDTLRTLGAQEAGALTEQLARLETTQELLVLTHVPPFAEACWYEGRQSEPDWLPWFSCISVGEVLLEYARQHPATAITVLCGHSHGQGDYRPTENLLIKTGGWPRGQSDYGNPIVQTSWLIN